MKIFALFALILIYSCSKETVPDEKIKNNFYDKAYEYRDKGEIDSAFLYFYKAKDLFVQQKDSYGAGKCLVNLAILQEQKGDYFGSQETAISALRYFDIKDSLQNNYLSINYNTLSITSSKLKNYGKAVDFYKKAIDLADDPINKSLYLNNLAINYKEKKEYSKAISIFESLIKNEKIDNSNSKIFDNLAFTRWLQNPKYNPVPEFQKVLKLRLRENDSWGLNASYSHLADYYSAKKSDSAFFYADKMYQAATEIKSPDDKIEALQKLISLEKDERSRHYFGIYKKLNDSLQTARNKAKNQFALIRYETEKNKTDFLEAKAESAKRQSYIVVQYFVLGIVVLICIFGYYEFKKSKERLKQEKLLEVKNTELKFSKKVHDKVANRIYQIMSHVENTEHIDKNALLFGLETAYEISRDLSYDSHDINENKNYSEQIDHLLYAYSSKNEQIMLNGNQENIWEGVNFQTKTEVYLILQELMTNMKKHSKATIIFIKFQKENNFIKISYTDNGIGLKDHLPKNGLQNMENRIHAINGKINFDSETNNLLKINISFPL